LKHAVICMTHLIGILISFTCYKDFHTWVPQFALSVMYKSKAIPCQFSGSGQATLSNFPEILLKLSLPLMMISAKFE